MSLRVIGGRFRGRALRTVRGLAVRPSPAMLRETLFDLVGPAAAGARFLDLCAGSGAVGIEALSRGAAHATFVDDHPSAIAVVRRNLEALGVSAGFSLLLRDAARACRELARRRESFDAAFLDPPYAARTMEACLRSEALRAIIAPHRRLYVQHPRRQRPPEVGGWARIDERRFGDTLLTVLERLAEGES